MYIKNLTWILLVEMKDERKEETIEWNSEEVK